MCSQNKYLWNLHFSVLYHRDLKTLSVVSDSQSLLYIELYSKTPTIQRLFQEIKRWSPAVYIFNKLFTCSNCLLQFSQGQPALSHLKLRTVPHLWYRKLNFHGLRICFSRKKSPRLLISLDKTAPRKDISSVLYTTFASSALVRIWYTDFPL